jgi:hypothetical protein
MMKRMHGVVGALLALALTGASAPSHATPAMMPPHITPTVVLEKQADLIKETLPGAKQYFLRTVDIGKADFGRIEREGGFKPEGDRVKFYYGKDGAGKEAGVVLFPQVNTQHGPLEVGLTMNPDGTVRDAVVTKATVETKPWVLQAVKAGLMKNFEGMRPGDDPAKALQGLSSEELGKMPYYMAEIAAKAVGRGLVLYDVLYSKGR